MRKGMKLPERLRFLRYLTASKVDVPDNCVVRVHHAIETTIHTVRKDLSHQDHNLTSIQMEKKLQRKAIAIVDEMLATITSTALRYGYII